MIATCPTCAQHFECPYYRLGLARPCPHCDSMVPINLRNVEYSSIGNTGYQTTFGQFVRLLNEDTERGVLQRMIRRTLSLRAESVPPTGFLTATDDPVSLADVHEQIQQHPQLQYDVYQYRMNLWR
ncbi:MAG TPA: hypothetical protein VGD69_04370 [Herpetosiphonaceae bacterium]